MRWRLGRVQALGRLDELGSFGPHRDEHGPDRVTVALSYDDLSYIRPRDQQEPESKGQRCGTPPHWVTHDVDFRLIGERALKGIEGDVALFEADRRCDRAGSGIVDPVCGMTVDPSATAEQLEVDGRTIVFCSQSCLDKFRADPARYGREPATARSRSSQQWARPERPDGH